jgi:hypothetical protein
MKNIFIIIKITILSILIFFSISYLYVLYRISPITIGNTYNLEIGFPFTYYEQFQVSGSPFLNSGWHIKNLMTDCTLTWGITAIGYFSYKKTKKTKS